MLVDPHASCGAGFFINICTECPQIDTRFLKLITLSPDPSHTDEQRPERSNRTSTVLTRAAWPRINKVMRTLRALVVFAGLLLIPPALQAQGNPQRAQGAPAPPRTTQPATAQ